MKAKRLQSRAVEKEQRRLHIPTIDRSYGDPPPFVVVVQGPAQVLHIYLFIFIDLILTVQMAILVVIIIYKMVAGWEVFVNKVSYKALH